MTSSRRRGIFEEAQAQAVKEVVAWQLAEATKKRNISKNKMATLLKTSRSQLARGPKTACWRARLSNGAPTARERLSIITRDTTPRIGSRGSVIFFRILRRQRDPQDRFASRAVLAIAQVERAAVGFGDLAA